MNFCVIHQPSPDPARSPFRVVEQPSRREVDWVNRFLDRERIRRVSNATLRTYAHDVLYFLRWWSSVHRSGEVAADALSESTLLDYLRFQASQEPQLSGSTINQRIAVADRALRAMFPESPRQVASGFQVSYWRRTPMGMGRQRPALSRLRVKTPKRVIVPLSVDEVARFWASFRTSRDLAVVGLMLLEGLRFQEVLDLNREDLLLPEAQIRVRGKGAKTFLAARPRGDPATRLLPAHRTPDASVAALFVSLKGRARACA
jgi:integrase